jgi:pyruvate/2-oxoglutarate dehydrogenase complex dihydrolipoamide acyltransferase (E2) component
MKMTLKLNRVGMNMSEATIVSWNKKIGDTFVLGDVIYSIETEKVTQDIEATANGSMLEILVPEGEDADVGQAICIVDVGT